MHGRAAGDAVLRAVAERLKANVREGDVLARFGNNEFAVLLEDVETPREAEAVARKIGAAFHEVFQVGGRQLALSASIGITVWPTDAIDPVALLSNAEIALRQAKQQGQSGVRFFSPSMHEEVVSYHRLEIGLKNAIKQGQFELKYQPQHRLADHRVEAVEALLHWNHPERGLLTPAEFVPVAEQNGCFVELGLWAIEEVCRQLERWEKTGSHVPRVGIDVVAMQFRDPGFPESLNRVLQSHSVDPELIELEVTERSLVDDNLQAARERLFALRDIGVRLAIDDFGSGRLRLDELQQLPLDVLKIGSSFVSGLDTSKDAQAVCGAILSIAHGFSLDAVANGVGSAQQEAFLAKHNCLYGQGSYYSPPLGADQVGALMSESGGQSTRRRRVIRKRLAVKAG
jgi:predicted signal transduction protein with EAL and GGDEF domain